MTAKYVVTFEYDERKAEVARGTVSASSAATCMARAMREAQKAVRPIRWASCVCVLLERDAT